MNLTWALNSQQTYNTMEKTQHLTNFGEALRVVKEGGAARRAGWNGKGMFIFMRPADELEIDFVVNKVKSLPAVVKGYFAGLQEDINHGRTPEQKIKFTPYLCLKAADQSIVNGWVPPQTDMLAEDWEIL